LRLEVSQELQSVVNFGIGVERVFTPSFSLSASFRSDNSGIKGDGRTDGSAASWNIYFVTVGSNFTLGGGALALGLAYGFGNESTDEFFGDSGDEILEPLPDDAQLEYRTLRLIIAFAF
jgi:long-subunit fatty acid transport protein